MGEAGSSGDALRRRESHIIARPRLTRLLDQAPARIVILVAPAGYGKTTIAQQWLAPRRHAWYRGTPASRDVGFLAVGLAEALGGPASVEAQKLRSRLTVSGKPEADVEALAELLRRAIARHRDSTVLAIDDYDAIAASHESERLIWELVSSTDAQVLVAARARPSWATARRLLYGEISELGQQTLAMDPDEAAELLSHRPGTTLPGLAALAQGWPAVLGLAALTGDVPPTDGLPDELYDFFAEELYQQVPEWLRKPLMKIAFVETLDDRSLELLLGKRGMEVIETAIRIGFLTPSGPNQYAAHPLVRTFLEKKAVAASRSDRSIGNNLINTLLRGHQWDDAFNTICRFQEWARLEDLISNALPEMIRTGRVATLERWANSGKRYANSPTVDLVLAEVALRRSSYEAAETMALRAAEGLPPKHPLHARSLMAAGNAAHLVDGEERGFAYHSRARASAQTDDLRRQATWGQLICANQLDLPVVEDLVRELEASSRRGPEDGLRLATMRGVIGLRGAGISKALPALHAADALLAEAGDPLARTSFLNVYARCLALGGFYEDASLVAARLISDARENRLDFVLPHALVAKAIAEAGARRPAAALRLLDEAGGLALAMRDIHNQVDADSLRCRIAVSLRRHKVGLEATARAPEGAGPGARCEYLLSRALALVGSGKADLGLRLRNETLAQSGRSRKGHEVRSIARWIPAVVDAENGKIDSIVNALGRSVETGVVDGFVVAYRGFPRLLRAISEDETAVNLATPIIKRVGDEQKARDAGISSDSRGSDRLSPRELEVYELLAAGRTNRQIGAALFISEVTVKVHVRHILRKLGAKTRTEAAARGVTEPLP